MFLSEAIEERGARYVLEACRQYTEMGELIRSGFIDNLKIRKDHYELEWTQDLIGVGYRLRLETVPDEVLVAIKGAPFTIPNRVEGYCHMLSYWLDRPDSEILDYLKPLGF